MPSVPSATDLLSKGRELRYGPHFVRAGPIDRDYEHTFACVAGMAGEFDGAR